MNTMNIIPEFRTLPLEIASKIIMMTPYDGILESHKNCMDQLINMQECLDDYKSRDKGIPSKWTEFTYKDFALHKTRQKKNINKKKIIIFLPQNLL